MNILPINKIKSSYKIDESLNFCSQGNCYAQRYTVFCLQHKLNVHGFWGLFQYEGTVEPVYMD